MKILLERVTAIILLAFFLLVGLFSYTTQLSASDNASQPNQLLTLPVFQLLSSATPTATRTPTPINIGNFVWDDIDHDGRQDTGEPGIAGVTVQLWNSSETQLIAQTTTNANGNYTVIAPLPGDYRIRVLLSNDNDSFSPKDQAGGNDQQDSDINPSGTNFGFTNSFTLASNVISTTIVDAGIIKFRTPTPTRTPTPINIGSFVWDDLDQDGRQDAGEPGLAGVTVQLWNSGKTQLIAQTVTNANGNYTVVAPLPGDYRIRVILPGVLDSFSPKNQAGGDDLLDSDINPSGANLGFTDVISIANNVISMTSIDAGVQRYRTPTPTRTPTPINVGNFVWNDLDRDGRQDAGEPGLAGITVQLWNAAKTQMLAQTVTGANGIYTLIAPVPGDYRVRVVLPNDNNSFSPKDQAGGNDQEDSDINPSGTNAGFTDIYTFGSNLISITTIDAGVTVPQTLNPDILLVQPIASATLPLLINTNTCGGFRLTSPLDGLPNGVASFYWDPANGAGVTYQITVMDEGRNVLATFAAGNNTRADGDISQRVIGGSYQVIVQVTALVNGRAICNDERMILREAPQLGEPPIQRVTPTPTRPPTRGN